MGGKRNRSLDPGADMDLGVSRSGGSVEPPKLNVNVAKTKKVNQALNYCS